MKKILITGATGFIGRNLIEHYSETNEVVAIYNKREPDFHHINITWKQADLRNPKELENIFEDIDVCMHFAATTTGAKDIVSKPYIHVTDNVVMTSLLMREAFHQGVKHFIFPSCTIMYQKSEKALKETDFNPSDELQSFYFGAGHTKIYLEKMCEFYSRLSDCKYTAIRHSNLYGPHDKFDLEKSHVTGATVTKVMTSKDGIVNVWGTGEEKRDLLYIDDFINFTELALTNQTTQCELFNVGLGEGIKIKDLVKKVIEASGKELLMKHDLTKPTVPTSLFLDCAYAYQKLGWKPKYTLEQGITNTIKWWRTNYEN